MLCCVVAGVDVLGTFVAALTQVLAAAVVLAPLVVPLAASHLSEKRRAQLLTVARGVALSVARSSATEGNSAAENAALVLADVESELARSLSEAERRRLAGIVAAQTADPLHPMGGLGVAARVDASQGGL